MKSSVFSPSVHDVLQRGLHVHEVLLALCSISVSGEADIALLGDAKLLTEVYTVFSLETGMKVKVKSLNHVRLFATPWTIAYQAPLSVGFSRQEY